MGALARPVRLNVPAQLTEIDQRNPLRRECKLPPLDRTYEIQRLRRLLELEWNAAFWEPELCRRIKEKHLARERRRRNDSTWVPSGMIKGLDFGLGVEKTLCRIYRMRASLSGGSP
jgi:hypothetical protein